MEILIFILILGVFMVPSFLMARSQKRRQAEQLGLQNSVQVGDRIVTVSGFHADVVDAQDSTLTLELSPGVEATMERAGVMRKVEAAQPPAGEVPGSAGSYWDNNPSEFDAGANQHPEVDQHPEVTDRRLENTDGHPENTDQHPENFRYDDPNSDQGGAR